MSFERLTIGDAIAWVAALALLLFTAVDWYSTVQGNEARQIQHDVSPSSGALGGEVQRDIQEQASLTAQADEKNLWQEKRAIDRLELLLVLATALTASAAAVFRVGGQALRRLAHAERPGRAAVGGAGARDALPARQPAGRRPGHDAEVGRLAGLRGRGPRRPRLLAGMAGGAQRHGVGFAAGAAAERGAATAAMRAPPARVCTWTFGLDNPA